MEPNPSGRGAQFWFTVPYEPCEAPLQTQPPPPGPPGEGGLEAIAHFERRVSELMHVCNKMQ